MMYDCVAPKSQYYTVSCRHIYYAILILILYITIIRILLLIEIIMPLCQHSNAVITLVNIQFYNNIATHRLNKLPEASTTSLSASQQVHRHHLHTNVQYGFLLIRGRKRELFPRCALHVFKSRLLSLRNRAATNLFVLITDKHGNITVKYRLIL